MSYHARLMSTAAADDAPPAKRFRLPTPTVGAFGTVLLLLIALPCIFSLPFTLGTPSTDDKGTRYNDLRLEESAQEQEPGMISFTRQLPRPEGAPEGAPAPTKTYRAFEPMGTDQQGRSVFVRCLLGGAISLGVGISAALMAVSIGVTWGAMAGFIGGRTDSFMMRVVDILYGLPYLLLVVLLSVAVSGAIDNFADGYVGIPDWAVGLWQSSAWLYALACAGGFIVLFGAAAALFWLAGKLGSKADGVFDVLLFSVRMLTVLVAAAAVVALVWAIMQGLLMPAMERVPDDPAKGWRAPVPGWLVGLLTEYPLVINLVTLVVAIGGVSWLTMARVIRGQVLSLRTLPFIEAARAQGMGAWRIMRVHLLPNLVGPIVVYTTLAVPQAILQESFLSFLGIGVTPPLPSWGQLASEGIKELPALALPQLNQQFSWWLLVFPCVLLGLTLLSLNFMGDAMRERFDPRSKKRGA